MDWNLGIFAIMSIITAIILLITATRFVYIDPKYREIIKQYEIKTRKNSDDGNDDTDLNRIIYHLEIGKYQIKREDNRSVGFIIDILSLLSIIILGCITIFGLFESQLLVLIMLLFLFAVFPVFHFWKHLGSVNREKSI